MADQQEIVLKDVHTEWFRRMAARREVFQPLCEMFPQVDYRLINATIIEHGSDMAACVESISNDLLPELDGAPTTLTSLPEASQGISAELAQGVDHRLHQPIVKQLRQEEPTPDDDLFAKFYDGLGKLKGSRSPWSDLTEPHCTAKPSVNIEDTRILELARGKVSHLEKSLAKACSLDAVNVLSYEVMGRNFSSPSSVCSGQSEDVEDCHDEDARHSSQEQSDDGEARQSSSEESDDEAFSASSFENGGRHDFGNNDIKGDCPEFSDFVGSQLTRDDNYGSVHSDTRDDNYSSVHSGIESASSSKSAIWGSLQCSASQVPTIEVLDQKVRQARYDKDDLIGALSEIRALRLEVEEAEAAARQAKVDAANAGADMLAKAKEVRDQTANALKANEMHHGEVFGEKAVLATEARELHTRLLQVTEEKTNAVNNLRQIKAMLHGLLDKAAEEKEAANRLKLENEAAAKKALSLEMEMLDNVKLETEQLEMEAEDCRKLREFLIESGSVVDSLQGEVAILCEDVEVVKRQVEDLTHSTRTGYVTQASMSVRSTQGGSHSTSSKSSTNHGVQMTGVKHASQEPAETPLVQTPVDSIRWSTATAESGNKMHDFVDHDLEGTYEGRIEGGGGTELISTSRGGPVEDSKRLESLDGRKKGGNEYVSLASKLLKYRQQDDNAWQMVDRWDLAYKETTS